MIRFAAVLILILAAGLASAQTRNDSKALDYLLSPNVSADAVPKDLKFPDTIIPVLKNAYNGTVGKENAFAIQFKIVLLGTKVTNNSEQKYSFFEMVAVSDTKTGKDLSKIKGFSPDARVLAINSLAPSKNPAYINALLVVLERDDAVNPRIAAAKVIPQLGKDTIVVKKLVELLRTQYGGSRAKFKESDQERFDNDKVCQAIVETLGDIGDPDAFPALMQVATESDRHRDETVKAAWEAMKRLQW